MGGVKRWRGRGPSVTIRVDEAAAKALEAVPQAERRAFASAAIISALKNNGIKNPRCHWPMDGGLERGSK